MEMLFHLKQPFLPYRCTVSEILLIVFSSNLKIKKNGPPTPHINVLIAWRHHVSGDQSISFIQDFRAQWDVINSYTQFGAALDA